MKISSQDDDLYSRFNYFLETDATHTLDEALKYLEEEREYKKLSQEEQQRQANLQGHMQRGSPFSFMSTDVCKKPLGEMDASP